MLTQMQMQGVVGSSQGHPWARSCAFKLGRQKSPTPESLRATLEELGSPDDCRNHMQLTT